MYIIYWYYQLLLNVILVLTVLKKNYTNLFHCLPQNYLKTTEKLRQLGCPDHKLRALVTLPTTDHINENIVGALMVDTIKLEVGALKFCDDMDNLVDSASSKRHIEIFRNGN